MPDLYYDDTELRRMFAELSEKERIKALRGAFRHAGNKVRKVALQNLHGSLNADRQIDRGVRVVVYREKACGFRVTIGTKKANRKGKGERGFYISRRLRGKAKATGKPVLIWAEEGTAERYTRRGRKAKAARGAMPATGFMTHTKARTAGSVTQMLHTSVVEHVTKVAKKHGCK